MGARTRKCKVDICDPAWYIDDVEYERRSYSERRDPAAVDLNMLKSNYRAEKAPTNRRRFFLAHLQFLYTLSA